MEAKLYLTHGRFSAIIVLAACVCTARGGFPAVKSVPECSAPQVAYVDEFDLSHSSCGLGKMTQARKTVGGNGFSVCGKAFERGFGTHPEGAVAFRINGKVLSFDAQIALDDESTNDVPYRASKGMGANYDPEAVFKVWVDGRIVWKSREMRPGMKSEEVHVDLEKSVGTL